jgi:3-phenylpropionate/trans-cinnamate dioxygenase ferredoxin subunit
MKHRLFPIADLPPASMRAASLNGVNVVVVRKADGSLRALRDICPHLGARLSDGLLQQIIVGDAVGERRLGDELIVRCPWHGHEFDIATGRCSADPRQRVRVYDTTVEDGIVVVDR